VETPATVITLAAKPPVLCLLSIFFFFVETRLSNSNHAGSGTEATMLTRLKFFLLAAGLVASICLSSTASTAQTAQQTGYGHIIALQTGSLGGPITVGTIPRAVTGDDTMAVNLDVPFVNSSYPNKVTVTFPPVPCQITTGGYALDPQDSGVKLNEAVLLSAYLAGRKVSLNLDGCVFDKPKIVSVSMSTSNN
jgi:hypothetical protein